MFSNNDEFDMTSFCQPCNSSNSSYISLGLPLANNQLSLPEGWANPPQGALPLFPSQEETPIEVKTELKKAIQEKKLANGEEIPEIEWREPPPPQPRPPEKPEEIQQRREKNKAAAMKCRQKKRTRRLELEKKIKEKQEQYTKLTEEVAQMRKEVKELKNVLENHHCTLNAGNGMNGFTILQQFAAQQTQESAHEQFNFSLSQ